MIGYAGAPQQGTMTPPPRFGQKVRADFTSRSESPTPSSEASARFGSGAMSGFRTVGSDASAPVSSSMLLAKMRERNPMGQR